MWVPVARVVEVSEQVRAAVPDQESYSAVARRRRRRNKGPSAGLHYRDGWTRSADDQRLLEWITRLGVMSVRQAGRYVYPTIKEQAVRKRVGRMIDAGLLKRIDTLPWAGVIIWPTAQGRAAAVPADSPLRAMEAPADSTMLHRLLVAEEALKRLVAGVSIITEREARLYEVGSAVTLTEERDFFLQELGVVRSVDGSAGVVPSVDTADGGTVERWLTLLTPEGDTAFRIPDLIEVTKRGELRAIEVESASKRPWRMRAILSGYRDACLGHQPAPKNAGWTLRQAGPLRRQFQGVHWVSTESVMTMLRGYESGINPFSGQADHGMVRSVWDGSPTTHLFYEDEHTQSLTVKGWPLTAELLDLRHDPGLEYALHQRTLPVTYRTSLSSWARWRRLWESDVAGDTDPVEFTHWLRAPGNLARCVEITG